MSELSEIQAVHDVPIAHDAPAACDAQNMPAAQHAQDASGDDVQDASGDDALTQAEKGSLDRMLEDKYRIPLILSALEMEKVPEEQVSVDPTVTDPTQIFLLTLPDNYTHYRR